VIAGDLSVKQLDNSNVAYAESSTASWFTGTGIPAIFLLGALGCVWFKPIKSKLSTLAVVTLLGLGSCLNCQAYYDRLDNDEWYTIGANETAFLIPLVGANQTSQGRFMSEEYLEKNVVATKRIKIPHVTVHNAGWANPDMYVPAAQLIVVDRTACVRSWIAANDRGTSTKNQGFYCESSDSINIQLGIIISASVTPEQGPKFLYNFGTKEDNNGNRGDPQRQYVSIIQGKSLADVLDTIVYGKVQQVLAREVGARKLEEVIFQKKEIMNTVEKEVQEFFMARGLTVDYVGLADALNYDPAIQKAINDKFIAEKIAQAQAPLQSMMEIRQTYANIALKEQTAAALGKWDGKLPSSFVVLPDGMLNQLLPQVTKPATTANAVTK
jgi:hypothetical protein